MNRKTLRRCALAVAVLAPVMAPERASAELIVNGSFEVPDVTGTFALFANGAVPGWTSPNNLIEIDTTANLSPGFGTPAVDGAQSAEIDAPG
jgi:hypothetical protein